MRKKLLNNSLTNSISKGGVLYRPGEIPALTKEQIAQANLVNKLPRDFPIANWESMNTRQQLQQMKYSGLNAQEQWSLLNSNVPLAVLSNHNQAETQSESTALAARVAASLVSASAKAAVPPTPTPGDASSNYTPLLSGGLREKLNTVKEEYKKTPVGNTSGKVIGKASGRLGGTVPIKAIVEARVGSEIVNPNSRPTNTPSKYNIDLVTPTPAPRMTPSPSPIPTPSPTPTPTPTPKSAKRETMLDAGFTFLNEMIGKPYCFDPKKYNRYGDGEVVQFDCTGLAISYLSKCGSKLIFKTNYIANNCAGMVKSIEGTDYGKITYDYKKDEALPELQRGDFVFYADPKNLNLDVHVAVATGEMFYDPVKNEYFPEVIEASAVAKKVTGQYLAYNDTNEDGLYERDHSDQIITHVIQWNLEWDDKK